MQRRFGDALKTVPSQAEQTRLSAGMVAYRTELQSLSRDDIDGRVNEELAKEAGAQDERNEAAFADWSQLALWTLQEAVVLTLGKNPDTWSSLDDTVEFSLLGMRFAKLRRRISRAKDARELTDPVSPKEFIAWADTNGVSIPPWFKQNVDQGQATDPKGLYETSHQLSAVTSELEGLKVPDRPVGGKERNTFLKLVLGMALRGYGYDPHASRSPKAKEIAEDLAELGIPLDEDTVRTKLREAADEYSHLLTSPDAN